jgi:membrane protease YdiL (CAAX protease family)
MSSGEKEMVSVLRNKALLIFVLVLIGCVLMYYVESVIQPKYMDKSFFKILIFCGMILFYYLVSKDHVFKTLFLINDKRKLKKIIILGVLSYLIIIIVYMILASYIDLGNIEERLSQKEGITTANCIPVFLYISIINSFLEEIFFRGLAFLQFKKYCNRKVAYLFSAISFSLYHLAILTGWFNPILFFAILILLIICGFILNFFDEKNNNIYFSWIIHMFSNLSINTIGIYMFLS